MTARLKSRYNFPESAEQRLSIGMEVAIHMRPLPSPVFDNRADSIAAHASVRGV